MLRILLLTGILALGSACTTKIDGLYVSEAFNAPNIKSGSILTGGVVNQDGRHNRSESNTYATIMLSKIKDEREYARLQPVESLINALGEKTYDAMLRKYASSGLDEQALSAIADKLSNIQFLALAKIEADQTEASSHETSAGEVKDEKGNVTKTPPKVTKKHRRTTLVSMHIYDLKSKNLAFSGQLSKHRENERTYEVNTLTNVLSVVNAVQGKDTEQVYPTPNAPETRLVLADIFEGFAENFPKD
ncbi:MAG: hypothetical protein ACOH5I_12170 [Oligoflexus sp.]